MTKEIKTGDLYFFGWNKIKNTVVSVSTIENNNQYKARLTLVGPRGGEYQAFVRHNGTVRKV